MPVSGTCWSPAQVWPSKVLYHSWPLSPEPWCAMKILMVIAFPLICVPVVGLPALSGSGMAYRIGRTGQIHAVARDGPIGPGSNELRARTRYSAAWFRVRWRTHDDLAARLRR